MKVKTVPYNSIILNPKPNTGALYEEVAPLRVLDERASTSGGRDFLVQWPDGSEDSWVSGLGFRVWILGFRV